jgi:hypothetical protein
VSTSSSFPSAFLLNRPLTPHPMSWQQYRARGGQRPTRRRLGPPNFGYNTDPERDQERGGSWGTNTNTTRNWGQGWALDNTSTSPTPTPEPSTSTTAPTHGGWGAPPTHQGATALNPRMFDEATRGRGLLRGIRPMNTKPPVPPPNSISLDEPPPPRRRYSPAESFPDLPIAHSLTERVRRAGVITNAEDRHIPQDAYQIINDLLFKLKQTEDDRNRLTTKVHDLMKKRNIRQRDENDVEEGSRLTKRRDPNNFSATPSQMSTPSSTGLSIDFKNLRTVSRETPRGPRTTTETPFMGDDMGSFMDPPFARQESLQITPPGRLDPDPIVRSDPRGTSTVPAVLPVAIDESDDSDDSDVGGMTARQREKRRNKAVELERGRQRLRMS